MSSLLPQIVSVSAVANAIAPKDYFSFLGFHISLPLSSSSKGLLVVVPSTPQVLKTLKTVLGKEKHVQSNNSHNFYFLDESWLRFMLKYNSFFYL